MSNRLADARRSLIVSSVSSVDSVDFSHKQITLAKLQSKLESALNPLLNRACVDQDYVNMTVYYRIYQNIDRIDQFNSLHLQSRRSRLLMLWKVVDSSSAMQTSFYEDLYLLVNREYSWYTTVCEDALDKTSILVFNLFESLQSLMGSFVEQLLMKHSNGVFPDAIHCFHHTEVFIRYCEKLGLHNSQKGQWSSLTILQPFTFLFKNLQSHQVKHLLSVVKSAVSGNAQTGGNFRENVVTIIDCMRDFSRSAETSLDLCQELTHGHGIIVFNSAVNLAFIEAFQLMTETMKSVYNNSLSSRTVKSGSSSADSSKFSSDDALDAVQTTETGVSSAQDWSNFQSCLMLLNAIYKLWLDLYHDVHASAARANEMINVNDPKVGLSDSERVMKHGTPSSVKFIKQALHVATIPKVDKWIQAPVYQQMQVFGRLTNVTMFSTLFLPIKRLLCDASHFDVWRSTHDSSRPRAAFQGLTIPSFSISPGAYVYRVGEHLLTLPQQLDDYLSNPSDALKQNDALLFWFQWLTDCFEESLLPHTSSVAGGEAISETITSDAYTVTHLLLSALAYKTVSYFLHDQICKISKGSVTFVGGRHLMTDVEYLMNVILALGVIDETATYNEETQDTKSIEQVLSNRWSALHNEVCILQDVLRFTVRQEPSDLAQGVQTLKDVWRFGSANTVDEVSPDARKTASRLSTPSAKRVFVIALQLMHGITFNF